MQHQVLIERAQRHRRIADWLITHHPLIARTSLGARLLRRAEALPGMPGRSRVLAPLLAPVAAPLPPSAGLDAPSPDILAGAVVLQPSVTLETFDLPATSADVFGAATVPTLQPQVSNPEKHLWRADLPESSDQIDTPRDAAVESASQPIRETGMDVSGVDLPPLSPPRAWPTSGQRPLDELASALPLEPPLHSHGAVPDSVGMDVPARAARFVEIVPAALSVDDTPAAETQTAPRRPPWQAEPDQARPRKDDSAVPPPQLTAAVTLPGRVDVRSEPAQREMLTPPMETAPGELFVPIASDRTPRAWAARLAAMHDARSSTPVPPGAWRQATPRSANRPVEVVTTPASALMAPQLAPVEDVSPGTPIDTAALFAPSANDRSPETWAAGLAAATRGAQPSAPAEAGLPRDESTEAGRQARPSVFEHAASPLPLDESSRRFLQPLVGIDPSEVRIHRGDAADRALASRAADALVMGDEIVIGSEPTIESPSMLGVVAHELTHIAQAHAPRFVPPIACGIATTADNAEQVARHVEARVARLAEIRTPHAAAPEPAPRAAIPSTLAGAEVTPSASQGTELPSRPTSVPTLPADRWRHVPAPWEPLPDWVRGESAAPATPTSVPSTLNTAPPAEAPAIQYAASDRELPAISESPPAAEHLSARAPEPDLDALAQQVYARLKQRLALERRRIG